MYVVSGSADPGRTEGEHIMLQLVDEAHGMSHDGRVVITVQWWSPNVLIVCRNGARVSRETGGRAALADQLTRARAAFGTAPSVALSTGQARERIAELTGADQTLTCPVSTCGAILPIGGYRCASCGLSMGRRAAGSLSGANRRGVIALKVG